MTLIGVCQRQCETAAILISFFRRQEAGNKYHKPRLGVHVQKKMATVFKILKVKNIQNILRSSYGLSRGFILRYRNATKVLLGTSCRRLFSLSSEWQTRNDSAVRKWSASVGVVGCLCGTVGVAFCYASGMLLNI